jgi:hypothetical protein
MSKNFYFNKKSLIYPRSFVCFRLWSAERIFRTLKCIAHEIQYHFVTLGAAMYAPCARNSFASWCSTKLNLEVTFLALSFGTVPAQLTH